MNTEMTATKPLCCPSTGTSSTMQTEEQRPPSLPTKMIEGWSDGKRVVFELLVKYFVFAVLVVLLFCAVPQQPTFFSVGFWIFWSVLVIAVQISFRVVHKILIAFWWVLMVYTLIVLTLVVLYQSPTIAVFWKDMTGLPDEWCSALGLVQWPNHSSWILPLVLFLLSAVHLKFFHQRFCKIVDTRLIGRYKKRKQTWPYCGNLVRALSRLNSVLWRLAEIHMDKLVAFLLACVATDEVSLIHMPVMLMALVMVFFPKTTFFLSVSTSFYLVLSTTGKMLVQMPIINSTATSFIPANCLFDMGNQTNHSWMTWSGFGHQPKLRINLTPTLLALMAMALRSIVCMRQRYERKEKNSPEPLDGVVFPDATRQRADDDICAMLRFLINYFFYKFGLELCFITTMITSVVRLDSIAMVFVIWLLMLMRLSRKTTRKVWRFYAVHLAAIIVHEYVMVLGLPAWSCFRYPWMVLTEIGPKNEQTLKRGRNILTYLFLPTHSDKLNRWFMLMDFVQFLLVCRQLIVFRIELRSVSEYDGGTNEPIVTSDSKSEHVLSLAENPVKDFVAEQHDFLDYVKCFVFLYWQWVTLFVLFMFGMADPTIFSLGYTISAFIYLWRGNDLYLKPIYMVIRKIRGLATYTVLVVFAKVILQFVSCGYSDYLVAGHCWTMHVFGLACQNPNWARLYNISSPSAKHCTGGKSDVELTVVYDVVCFIFLIIQLRCMRSWYFQRAIVEFRAEQLLSFRGAALIDQLLTKEMNDDYKKAEVRLKRIKNRTDKIRARTSGQLFGPLYVDSTRGWDEAMFDYNPIDDIASDPTCSKELVSSAFSPVEDRTQIADGTESIRECPTESSRELSGKSVEESTMSNSETGEESPSQSSSERPTTAFYTSSATKPSSLRNTFYPNEVAQFPMAPIIEEKKLGTMTRALALVARWLAKGSRDYRYVGYVLKLEKAQLKDILAHELCYLTDSRELRERVENGDIGKHIRKVKSVDDISLLVEEVNERFEKRNVFARLLIGFASFFFAYTQVWCYFAMVLVHAVNVSLLTLPLPFMVFLWGSLSIPRPSKMFWIAVIAYAEVIVVVKEMFKFPMFAWTTEADSNHDPFWAPRLLGIDHRLNSIDIIQAMLIFLLFYHRYMLRAYGLWRDPRRRRPTPSTVVLFHEREMDEVLFVPTPEDTIAVSLTSNGAIVQNSGPTVAAAMTAPVEAATTVDSSGSADKTAEQRRSGWMLVSFVKRLLHPPFNLKRDLYACMFLSDFCCFLIVAFSSDSFDEIGRSSQLLSISYERDVRLPISLIGMLMVHVVVMIIDRALYLRKAIKGKLVFQVLQVFMVQLFFFLLPLTTGKSVAFTSSVADNGPNYGAIFWYLFRSVYLLFSAWQIRDGYPMYIVGYMLMHSYHICCWVLFQIFMLVPFLFELRTLIDWTVTTTSLTLSDFFNLESFYVRLYSVKALRRFELFDPKLRGEKTEVWVKLLIGLPSIVGIVLLVWAPLLIYSLIQEIGIQSLPERAQFSIRIDEFPPLFESENFRLKPMDVDNWNELTAIFGEFRKPRVFLRDFDRTDSVNISLWAQSLQPLKRRWADGLLRRLRDERDVKSWLFTTISVQRSLNNERNEEPLHQSHEWSMPIPLYSSVRRELIALLESDVCDETAVNVTNVVPRFVYVPTYGSLVEASDMNIYKTTHTYWNVTLRRHCHTFGFGNDSDAKNHFELVTFPSSSKDTFSIIAFVSKTWPSFMSLFVRTGIVPMYIGVVLVVAQVVRSLVSSSPTEAIIREMPTADHLLRICHDIYVSRESNDLAMEHDLYGKLVFLFRSPETMLKWTRWKSE